MKADGIATCSLDISFGSPIEGKQNAMDLLSDAGFSCHAGTSVSLVASVRSKTGHAFSEQPRSGLLWRQS